VNKYVVGAAIGAAMLAGAFYGGCEVQRQRDDAAIQRAKQIADSQLVVISAGFAPIIRELEAMRRNDSIQAAAATALAEQFVQQAAQHEQADATLQTQLVAARTIQDSFRIVRAQAVQLREANRLLHLGFDTLLKANAKLQNQVKTTDSLRTVERTLAVARENALLKTNGSLALQIERLTSKKKFLGFLPEMACVAGIATQPEIEFRPKVRASMNSGLGFACGAKL